MAALAGATTVAQIATIKVQKPPEFARGGLLDGPSHGRGGMPVINPATGRNVAEVEGGEAILSRKTTNNNWGLVQQLLQSSMYGNGASITPAWQSRNYVPLNFSGITRSIERQKFFERCSVCWQ